MGKEAGAPEACRFVGRGEGIQRKIDEGYASSKDGDP